MDNERDFIGQTIPESQQSQQLHGDAAMRPMTGSLGAADPWIHRSEKMLCGTCMWYMVKTAEPSLISGASSAYGKIGRCRRHSPCMSGYPVVFVTDWCGDHKLDENK